MFRIAKLQKISLKGMKDCIEIQLSSDTESKVDPWCQRTVYFWNMVFPFFLHRGRHQQKRAMRQRYTEWFNVFIKFMTDIKSPGLAKAHEANRLMFAGCRPCITVPAD